MKSFIVTSVILLAGATGNAMADCTPQTRVSGQNLQNLLSGSLVCGWPGANYPGDSSDRWQEDHRVDGSLWDYKRGRKDPVDPSKQVGTWSIGFGPSRNTVTYMYGKESYTRTVHENSDHSYSFCSGGAEHVRANIIPNTGSGCSNFP